MTKLPKKISIAGIDIDIVECDMLEDEKSIGKSVYLDEKIYIDANACNPNTTNQAFWHEVIHWILFIMGEFDLKDNEKFVDMFAHLLYQVTRDVYGEEKSSVNKNKKS